MEPRTSPLVKSWLPAIKVLVAMILATVFFAFLLVGGLQNGETAFVLIGGLFSLCAVVVLPSMIWSMFTGQRGGYGQCPVCYNTIEAEAGDDKDLLCIGCGAYLDANIDRLETIEPTRVSDKPLFAAPTPWPDVRNVISATIAFSAQDYVQDKLNELVMKKSGVKLLNATWPSGCCVCGKPATRRDQFVAPVTLAGRIVDAKATLVANDVPYCAEHKDGIAFDRVAFNSGGTETSYGILFRSHAYREAFRNLNRWAWVGVVPRSPGTPTEKAMPRPSHKPLFRYALPVVGVAGIALVAASAALGAFGDLGFRFSSAETTAPVPETAVAVAATAQSTAAKPYDVDLLLPAVAPTIIKAREAQRHAIAFAAEGCAAADEAENAAVKAQAAEQGYVQQSKSNNATTYAYAGQAPAAGAYGVVAEDWNGSKVRFAGRNDQPMMLPLPTRVGDDSAPTEALLWEHPNGVGRVKSRDFTYCGKVVGNTFASGTTTWSDGERSELEGEGMARVPVGLGVIDYPDGRRAEGLFGFGPRLDGIGVIWTKDGQIESAGRFVDGKLAMQDVPSGIDCDQKSFKIYFGSDVSDMTDEAAAIAARAANGFAGCAVRGIALRGHSDGHEAAGSNPSISSQRAAAVKKYLLERGVPESVVTVEDRGFSEPVVATGPNDGEPLNRFVSVDIE